MATQPWSQYLVSSFVAVSGGILKEQVTWWGTMRYYKFIPNMIVHPSTVMSTYCAQDTCLSININNNEHLYSLIIHLNHGFYIPPPTHHALL